MSFTRPTFCGLTVEGFKNSLGLGSQTSTLSVSLVQDPYNGDVVAPPPKGWPAYFEFGNFRFGGLLQKWSKKNSQNGLPTYEAVVVDPREILEGVAVIISDYSGVRAVENVINVYGYWENIQFGASQSNETGMPWRQIRIALEALCNQTNDNTYGGPINFMGVKYGLDMSELPNPPSYYRINEGFSVYLLDMISRLCDDAGCDFFVELIGYTIKFRVINRRSQPPLGTITNLINGATFSGNVISSEIGVEVRNEATSAVVIGGKQNNLHLTSSIVSFWGYDINGSPIIGVKGTHPGLSGTYDFFNLNAAGVADILGSTVYPCGEIEMRAALSGEMSWKHYVSKFKPQIANIIDNIVNKNKPNPQIPIDFVNDARANVLKASDPAYQFKSHRLYEFVANYAREFYGRQYLVQLPLVLSKVDEETAEITYSSQPTDAGFLAEGASSLGLSFQNQDVFLAQDDRILPFVYYANSVGADTTGLNWSDTVIESSSAIYSRIQLSQSMVFVNGIPCAHIRLSSPLFDRTLSVYGDTAILNKVVANGINNANPNIVDNLDKHPMGGTIGGLVSMHPAARVPDIAAIPLVSNKLVYGPWHAAGAPGKVRVEQDENLTPWDYGGYTALNEAANARVLTAITNQQHSETGYIEVVGAPAYSLGDVLAGGGPNLTNIDVSYNTNGVTTTYRFQTFTQRFGLFSRQNAERMKRINNAASEVRRNLRKAINKRIAAQQTINIAAKAFLENLPKNIQKKSPHTTLVARSVTDGSKVRVMVGTDTYEAALTMCGANDDNLWKNTSITPWNAIFRPYSTNPSLYNASGNLLPTFNSVNRSHIGNNCVAADSYNPFADFYYGDVEIASDKSTYSGVYIPDRGGLDSGNARGIGLKGPIVLSGWGRTTTGEWTYGGEGWQSHLSRSDLWKTGPVDLLWDQKRGVWTSHDLMTAVSPSGIAANGAGTVYIGNSSNWSITAYNLFSTPIPSGTWLMVGYMLDRGNWYVTAVDCN